MTLALPVQFLAEMPPAVLFAETVNYFFPRLVEVHNYSAANAFSQKMYNWQTLNSACPTEALSGTAPRWLLSST